MAGGRCAVQIGASAVSGICDLHKVIYRRRFEWMRRAKSQTRPDVVKRKGRAGLAKGNTE